MAPSEICFKCLRQEGEREKKGMRRITRFLFIYLLLLRVKQEAARQKYKAESLSKICSIFAGKEGK